MKKSGAPSAHLTNDDLLLQGIIDNLRPFKKGLFEQRVEADVLHDIGALRKAAPLWKKLNDRPAMRKQAKKLDKALGAVEELVKSAPGTLGSLLEAPESFFEELRRMREVCGFAVNNVIGVHPNRDTCAQICAAFARGLMEGLSDAPVRSSSPQDNFRVVTGLLYQIVMRCKDDLDLERACDAELRGDAGIGNLHFRVFVWDSRS